MWRCAFSCFFSLLPSILAASGLEVDVLAPQAILINADSGVVLYEKDADQRCYPASTIKVATALYAVHVKGDKLDEMVTADLASLKTILPLKKRQGKYKMPSYWLETDAIMHGIQVGERMSFRDLLHCHLIRSAADASNMIAKHVSGSIPRFVEELNAYLKDQGFEQTHVTNPHGLHHPELYSTPREIALLFQKALQTPLIREIMAKASYTVGETNKSSSQTINQSNRLQRRGSYYYPKAIAGKTGYHSHAKYTLVAAAEQDGRTLIAAVFQETERGDRFKDSVRLFEKAFKEEKLRRRVLTAGLQAPRRKVQGANRELETVLVEDVYTEFYPSEACEIKAQLEWTLGELPIEAGHPVALLELRRADNGHVLKAVPLLAHQRVDYSLWARSRQWVSEHPRGSGVTLLTSAVLLLFSVKRRRGLRRR